MNMRNPQKWIGKTIPKNMERDSIELDDHFVSVWSGKYYHINDYGSSIMAYSDELYLAYKALGIEDASEVSFEDMCEIDMLVEKEHPDIFERNMEALENAF